MALPLIIAGAALTIASNYSRNQATASAETANAKFYEMQAQYAREAMSREAQLSRRKYASVIGAQVGAYAKGGVIATKGSSLGVIANTLASQMQELEAIRTKGELETSLARGRAAQARKTASTLRDPFYNLMQAGGTALTAYAAGAD